MKPVVLDCQKPKRKVKKRKCDDLYAPNMSRDHEDSFVCPTDIKTLRKLARKGEL